MIKAPKTCPRSQCMDQPIDKTILHVNLRDGRRLDEPITTVRCNRCGWWSEVVEQDGQLFLR